MCGRGLQPATFTGRALPPNDCSNQLRLTSVGPLVPYWWAGVGHVEGGVSGFAGAGRVSWLSLVRLGFVRFSQNCVFLK